MNVLLFLIGTFVILGLYTHYVLKYRSNFSYAAENELFNSFPNQSLVPKSRIDWFVFLFFILYVLAFAWNIFYQVDVRHSDSIGYISDAACNPDKFIALQVKFSGRFMPFAHQEFNLLSPLLRLFNCSYTVLYSLTFIQFLITIYIINKILPFKQLYLRLLAIFFITINIAFFYPFSNIIVNDRNTIFLTILFLYFIIKFYKTEVNKNLVYALIVANIAVYFKEPMFLFFTGFALASLLFKVIENKISLQNIIKKPIVFTKKYPLEIGLLMISSLFAIGYIYFIFFDAQTKFFYGQEYYDQENYFSVLQYLKYSFERYSLFAITLAIIFFYIKDFKNIKYRKFIASLFMGGLFYSLVMIFYLRPGFFAYYSIANLVIVVAACYYLSGKKLSTVFTIFLILLLTCSLKLTFPNIFERIAIEKKFQISIYSLRENIKLKENKNYNIYYYAEFKKYSAYSVTAMKDLIHVITARKSPIKFYSKYDCYPHHKGKDGDDFRCLKANNFILSDYDLVIFDRKFISKDEWMNLSDQYGNRMKQITKYPEIFGNQEEANLYVIYN